MTRSQDALSLTLDDYHGRDPAMQRCLEQARLAARTDLPILILGESGTGKTLLARAVHNSSPRRDGPFVSFNAAALSDTLLDSQLFGHERGAFTGAQNRVKGKFELANSGSLFIDEIADMSASGQGKILRAVEYGEFERLGSETIQVSDVRLLSATHFPMGVFTESERFRRDLFFRISGWTITLPPLRERRKDLPLLLASEIARASREQKKPIVGLERDAVDRVLAHAWPGNLRELSRVVDVAVASCEAGVVTADALYLQSFPDPDGRPASPVSPASTGAETLSLAAAERRHIGSVLARLAGNKRAAAKALGISRSTLDRKLNDAAKDAR
ncbi:MAG: sigma 54-interacting transcriptional regulator [Acidobacteriota bacterium]